MLIFFFCCFLFFFLVLLFRGGGVFCITGISYFFSFLFFSLEACRNWIYLLVCVYFINLFSFLFHKLGRATLFFSPFILFVKPYHFIFLHEHSARALFEWEYKWSTKQNLLYAFLACIRRVSAAVNGAHIKSEIWVSIELFLWCG